MTAPADLGMRHGLPGPFPARPGGPAGPMTRAEAVAQLTAPGAPAELLALQVQGQLVRWFKSPPCDTLRGLFETTASDLPFLRYRDELWTFAEAWADAARLAQVLVQDCGVRAGDRVAIAMRNYPEWVLGFTAATAIGAVAVALNAHWSADEMAYGLQDCGATVLLADAERLAQWAAGSPRVALQVLVVRPEAGQPLPEGARALQPLVDAQGPRGQVPMPAAQIAPDDLAIMMYTSGSTGHPKGVPSSHRNVLAALFSWELDRCIGELVAGLPPASAPVPGGPQPGTLLAVPLFHVTGSHASYLASYRAQRRMVCMHRWDPEEAARLIATHRLTSVVAPSAVTGDLVRVAKAGRHDLSSLLQVGGGGAPRPPVQVQDIAQSFGQALPNIGWGMTETNAIGTGNVGDDYLGRPSSSGRVSQLLDLRIVGDDGQALPAGQRGELQVRGSSVFGGYWQRPEASASAFADGGWFRTGDVAVLDEDGFLYIVDRIKDLIIRGGENIGCGAVEAALLLHPLVHEAAVYGVPDERLGEEVGATVHGAPGLRAEDLRAFIEPHLARFERPRHLLLSDTPLPRTASGKVLKRQIRAQALDTLARQGLWQAPPEAVDDPGGGPAAPPA